jgi:tetratricopeptide (TPR) repeat protein
MDRLAGMREEVAGMESGVGAAEAKTSLAQILRDQGKYEKALELLTEALGIYQSELSEEVRGAGCIAGGWVWGID